MTRAVLETGEVWEHTVLTQYLPDAVAVDLPPDGQKLTDRVLGYARRSRPCAPTLRAVNPKAADAMKLSHRTGPWDSTRLEGGLRCLRGRPSCARPVTVARPWASRLATTGAAVLTWWPHRVIGQPVTPGRTLDVELSRQWPT